MQELDEDDSPFPRWLEGDSLAPPCQADLPVVLDMLKFGNVSSSDVVYDLGCGDGRFLLQAALQYKARGVGVEIEPDLVAAFKAAVAEQHLESLITVISGDLREVDLTGAALAVASCHLLEATEYALRLLWKQLCLHPTLPYSCLSRTLTFCITSFTALHVLNRRNSHLHLPVTRSYRGSKRQADCSSTERF
jgi:16S rRNA A1518/A1519 N6-dimethyltransferase RsmA/KsgA/DIM1 with predicted DNA glycosylase/AP lyase activity